MITYDNWSDYYGSDRSLLGYYSSNRKDVVEKHVDWATGHGVNFFLINWPGRGGFQDTALRESFLKSDLVKRGDIKFALLYETIWRLKDSNPGWDLSDPENVEILREDFEYMSEQYFVHPSYLKINGKPFVYIFSGKAFFGDINKIDELKREFNLFLVSDHAHPWAEPSDIFRNVRWGDAAGMFDAILPGDGVYVPEEVGRWEEYKREGYEKWSRFCRQNDMVFIPNITVGISYRNCPWGDKNWPPVPHSPELFKKRLEIALPYVDKKLRMMILSEFNNFFEDAYIEPSIRNGFDYLNVLKEFLIRNL